MFYLLFLPKYIERNVKNFLLTICNASSFNMHAVVLSAGLNIFNYYFHHVI
ncbi:hypothetical protein [Bacillus cereus]|uniref:hypothetical protein n=1 Tax=Bacillus cereus TaxID=1396 RepID=UPI003F53D3D5